MYLPLGATCYMLSLLNKQQLLNKNVQIKGIFKVSRCSNPPELRPCTCSKGRNTFSPARARARTQILVNYAQSPFIKYVPDKTKVSNIWCFLPPPPPPLLWMGVKASDKAPNKYQVIKLHRAFVIRVFCLIPNCS